MPHLLKFLAFETSTDMMSVAVGVGDQTWHVHTQGGANASAQLIPSLHNLLAQAQIRLTDLSALVIGHGPGSFTGLRTACSVAQGLAMGANSAHRRRAEVMGVQQALNGLGIQLHQGIGRKRRTVQFITA